MEFTHFNDHGNAHMVQVGQKDDTRRVAIATGYIQMKPATIQLIVESRIAKGDVLAVAQVAGIMAAKKTSDFIPMCHPLLLTGVDLRFAVGQDRIAIEAEVSTIGKTGVEMEALSAVSIAALTIYDMCKAVDRDMIIGSVMLNHKSGGKSGVYQRPQEEGHE